VRALVQECGQDVNTANEHDNSLLHFAAAFDYTEMVQMLVEIGANLSALNKYGGTPLDWAARKGHTNTVRVIQQLLKRGFRAAEPSSRFHVEFPRAGPP
jgi:ankyrin repeat protein